MTGGVSYGSMKDPAELPAAAIAADERTEKLNTKAAGIIGIAVMCSRVLGLARELIFAALFGGGIAYQLSPSWDLRVQYRALLFKSVTFGIPQFGTNRYYIAQQPAIGFAYHF